MGYFSRLGCAMQSGEEPPAPVVREPESQPAPVQSAGQAVQASTAAVSTSVVQPTAATEPSDTAAPSVSAISLDSTADDTAARQAHEASEAKRKADWDAKQREKAAAEQARLNRLAAMSDEDAIAASTQRVGADTERLTRRNMKDCVAAHVQELCRQDPAFARKTLHPRKSMMHCFQYINRMAKKFVQDEMKANGVQPESGVYGDDIPDDLVYQWAVDYFNNPYAQEDKDKEDEFVPKPYLGKSSKTAKAAKAAPKAKREPAPKAKPQLNSSVDGQLSFLGVAG